MLNHIQLLAEIRLEKILLNETLYVEMMRDYRKIHTVDKNIMTLQNFGEFEKIVPSTTLCRVHKSLWLQ
jgi:DNA-binding LytR/AlgR family response regulator